MNGMLDDHSIGGRTIPRWVVLFLIGGCISLFYTEWVVRHMGDWGLALFTAPSAYLLWIIGISTYMSHYLSLHIINFLLFASFAAFLGTRRRWRRWLMIGFPLFTVLFASSGFLMLLFWFRFIRS